MKNQNRFRGCLLGLAVGDAVGTTVEFKPRGTFPLVTDMTGGGPFNLKRGEFTDDLSMALCIATSLVELNRFDAQDQMQRFTKWWKEGYLSSNGRCFDIGGATRNALEKFLKTGNAFCGSTDPKIAGNGGLMRLGPVPMFFYPSREVVIEMSGESSRMTHASAECIDAARLFGAILYQGLSGADKESILTGHGLKDIPSQSIQSIANGDYLTKGEAEISGSGYVVNSLEAALWCFATTDSFEEAILRATNLGDDADSTAAICGQVAGAYYLDTGIPEHWLKHLVMEKEIRELADHLCQWRTKQLPEDASTRNEVVQGQKDKDGYPCYVVQNNRSLGGSYGGH